MSALLRIFNAVAVVLTHAYIIFALYLGMRFLWAFVAFANNMTTIQAQTAIAVTGIANGMHAL